MTVRYTFSFIIFNIYSCAACIFFNCALYFFLSEGIVLFCIKTRVLMLDLNIFYLISDI